MRLFSPVRVITLGNKLKEGFAPRRFTLLFHQINDEGKWVFLNGPTHTLCYCHVCPPLCGSFGLGFSICVSDVNPTADAMRIFGGMLGPLRTRRLNLLSSL